MCQRIRLRTDYHRMKATVNSMFEWFAYEYRTVRSVRGTVARTLAKFEADGWELVSEESGAVRKTLKLRRARTRQGWLRLGGGVAAAVILVVSVGVGAALEGGDAGRGGKPENSAGSAKNKSGSEKPAAPKAPTVASSRDLPMVWDNWEIVDNDIDVDSDLYGAFDPDFWVRNTGDEPADGYFTLTFRKDGQTLGHASCTTAFSPKGGNEVLPGDSSGTKCDSDDPLVRGWTEITITSGESYDY